MDITCSGVMDTFFAGDVGLNPRPSHFESSLNQLTDFDNLPLQNLCKSSDVCTTADQTTMSLELDAKMEMERILQNRYSIFAFKY